MQRRVPGVGLLFNPALIDFVEQHAPVPKPGSSTAVKPALKPALNPALYRSPEPLPGSVIDHLAVIPDRCWVDPGPGAADRFQTLPAPLALIDRAAAQCPLLLHGIGLSICSADVFDRPYVDNLARWCTHWRAQWVSEHLSFSRVGTAHEVNAALALPIAYDDEMLDLLVPRIDAVQQRLGVPFLLENNVSYVDIPEQGMGEAEFLNRLCARTSCSLLLDLHNLYTNAVNHRFSAHAFLDALDLSRVLEVHIAGGQSMMGFHTDSHTGPVHEGVWPLLAAVASRATQLQAVTFEFHESSWPLLHTEGVLEQLNQARAVLERAAAKRAFEAETAVSLAH